MWLSCKQPEKGYQHWLGGNWSLSHRDPEASSVFQAQAQGIQAFQCVDSAHSSKYVLDRCLADIGMEELRRSEQRQSTSVWD